MFSEQRPFWLEEYLQSLKIAMILISHDRYLLDKLCKIYSKRNDAGNYKKFCDYRKFLQRKFLRSQLLFLLQRYFAFTDALRVFWKYGGGSEDFKQKVREIAGLSAQWSGSDEVFNQVFNRAC